MFFKAGQLYHVYNRGNQKQRIFFSPSNYQYFIRKMEKYIVPRADLLSWCLMPNHFHFLISANSSSDIFSDRRGMPIQNLSEGIRLLLSTYTKGFNRAMNLTGNLFQQRTKAKPLISDAGDYGLIAFNYIHQNPIKAKLVHKMEDWPYSSFKDYIGKRRKSMCNLNLAKQLFNLESAEVFYENTLTMPIYNQVNEIFYPARQQQGPKKSIIITPDEF